MNGFLTLSSVATALYGIACVLLYLRYRRSNDKIGIDVYHIVYLVMLIVMFGAFLYTTVIKDAPISITYILFSLVAAIVVGYIITTDYVEGLARGTFIGICYFVIILIVVTDNTTPKSVEVVQGDVVPTTATQPQEKTTEAKPVSESEQFVFGEQFQKYCDQEEGKYYPVCYDDYSSYFKEVYTQPTDGDFLQYLSYQRKSLNFITNEITETEKKVNFLQTLVSKMTSEQEKVYLTQVQNDLGTFKSSVTSLQEQQNSLNGKVLNLEQIASYNHQYMHQNGWVEEEYKIIDFPSDTLDNIPKFDYITYVDTYASTLSLSEQTLAWLKEHKAKNGE